MKIALRIALLGAATLGACAPSAPAAPAVYPQTTTAARAPTLEALPVPSAVAKSAPQQILVGQTVALGAVGLEAFSNSAPAAVSLELDPANRQQVFLTGKALGSATIVLTDKDGSRRSYAIVVASGPVTQPTDTAKPTDTKPTDTAKPGATSATVQRTPVTDEKIEQLFNSRRYAECASAASTSRTAYATSMVSICASLR
jgi:Pilus formation protein N terminal region